VIDRPNLTFNPKLLCVIIDRDKTGELTEALREKNIRHNYMINGMGTASSEILKAFGLSGTEKIIALCVVPELRASYIMTAVAERMDLVRPGHGIVFLSPISGISAAVTHYFEHEFFTHHERYLKAMNLDDEKDGGGSHELIIAVVNSGYSDSVMDAARLNGARGGTIVNAHRTGEFDRGKFFGITLHDEKEIVAILVAKDIRKELMKAISIACGIKTEARGIVFSIPVEDFAGLPTAETNH
jgi:uncharacterized protein YaaQ